MLKKRKWLFIAGAVVILVVPALLLNHGFLANLKGNPGQEAMFEKSLVAGKPTVLFFFSDNCEQCELMKEPVKKAQEEFSGSIAFFSINIQEPQNQNLVRKSGIRAIPTLVFYSRDGTKQSFLGPMKPEKLRERLILLQEDTDVKK